MEKLPLGERPFQAKHEGGRCGRAQQPLRAGLESQACWKCWTTRAAVPAELFCPLAAPTEARALPGRAGAQWLCAAGTWLAGVRALAAASLAPTAVSSMPHHPCCSYVEEGDPHKG